MCALHRGESARLAALANHRHLECAELLAFSLGSGASLVQCCDKGPANHIVQAVTTFMDFLGIRNICLRTYGQPRVLWLRRSRARETMRRSWRQRRYTRAHRLEPSTAANAASKDTSDACGSRSRSQLTSPLVSRTRKRLSLPTYGLAHHEISRAD